MFENDYTAGHVTGNPGYEPNLSFSHNGKTSILMLDGDVENYGEKYKKAYSLSKKVWPTIPVSLISISASLACRGVRVERYPPSKSK